METGRGRIKLDAIEVRGEGEGRGKEVGMRERNDGEGGGTDGLVCPNLSFSIHAYYALHSQCLRLTDMVFP